VVLPSLPESVAFTPRSAWRAGASASGASGRRHLESYGGWAPGRERDEIAKKHRGLFISGQPMVNLGFQKGHIYSWIDMINQLITFLALEIPWL